MAKMLRRISRPVGLSTDPRASVGRGSPVWRNLRSKTLNTRQTRRRYLFGELRGGVR